MRRLSRHCTTGDAWWSTDPAAGSAIAGPNPYARRPPFETFADRWLVELLDTLELDAATIVSTSFGGLFALRAVAAQPDRFVALKHLAWSAGAPIAHVPLVMRVAAVPSIGRLMTRLPLPRFVARSMLKQIGLGGTLAAGRIGDEFFEWFRSIATDTDTIRNEIDSLPAVTNVRHGLNEDLLLSEELLGSIRRPIEFPLGRRRPDGRCRHRGEVHCQDPRRHARGARRRRSSPVG